MRGVWGISGKTAKETRRGCNPLYIIVYMANCFSEITICLFLQKKTGDEFQRLSFCVKT